MKRVGTATAQPLYPQQRTCLLTDGADGECQDRTSGTQLADDFASHRIHLCSLILAGDRWVS
jgi:hypothetical protein